MKQSRGRRAPSSDDQQASTTASKRLADALRSSILSGEREPGSRLRQEDLADEFEISRIPVREALRQLESEGLIVFVPNSGAWIAQLDRKEFIEIYKIRERLEPLALQESCPRIDADTLKELGRLVVAMEEDSSLEEFLRLDREFHLLTYQAAQMPQLAHLIQNFWNTTQQYRRVFMRFVGPAGRDIALKEHRLILDALTRNDGELASLLLYGHIRRTRLEVMSNEDVFDPPAQRAGRPRRR